MEFIVFDLEWNQCPYGKNREVKSLPFEIIEIGAVKLNIECQIVDHFQRVIKPSVYPKLHYRTKEIVHLNQSTLRKGIPFPEAIREFLAWAGPEANFCTWGTIDLIELQRNMKYYDLLHLLKGPLHFFDVQKLFAIQYESMKLKRSLEYGIDFLHLQKSHEFHRALSDAIYTAEIFKRIDPDVIMAYDSIDVYQNPKKKTDEIHMVYNGYSKFISQEFPSKEAAMNDPEVRTTCCCLCGKSSRKKIRWFSVNSKSHYSMAQCPTHGYMKGKIRMKHTDEGNYYVIKTIKVSSKIEAEEIARKKEEVRARRKKKRK